MTSSTESIEFDKGLLPSNTKLTIHHSAMNKTEYEHNIYLVVPKTKNKQNSYHSYSSNTKESINDSENEIVNESREQMIENNKVNQLKEDEKFGDIEGEEIKIDPNATWSDPEEDLDYLDFEILDDSDDENQQNTESEDRLTMEENKKLSIYSQTPNEKTRQKNLFIQPKINIIPDPLASKKHRSSPCNTANSELSKSFVGRTVFY